MVIGSWPSLAQVGDSAVIADAGSDNSLLFYWRAIGTAGWHREEVDAPGTCARSPSVAQVGDASVIATQAPDGSLLFYWQPIGSEQWNPELVAGPRAGQRETVQAKALLEKAERLLPRTATEDRGDVERLMERVRTAMTDRKWEPLGAACNELSDVLFYLEDA